MTQTELARHTDAIWALFVAYAKEHGIENQTTGILVVSELGKAQPALCVMYTGDPKAAAVSMTRAAMAELKRAGVRLPGAGG
jgi:hypothetical protein